MQYCQLREQISTRHLLLKRWRSSETSPQSMRDQVSFSPPCCFARKKVGVSPAEADVHWFASCM